jgi:hypothetical protein
MEELLITDAADALSRLGDKYIIRSHLDNYYYLEHRGGFIQKLIRLEEKSWLVYKGDWSISKEELNGLWQCINSVGQSISLPSDPLDERRKRFDQKIATEDKWRFERLKQIRQRIENKNY